MMTFRQFAEHPPSIPAATSWYLADVAQALGKQELFTNQSPQKLKVLREHALIESAVALLDRGIPFTLTTAEVTSSHLQVVIGYDSLRRSFWIRDGVITEEELSIA